MTKATVKAQGSNKVTFRGLILAGGCAAVLFGTASLAHAQQAAGPARTNDLVSTGDPGPLTPPTPHKTYAFDNKGRWGVKLDLAQPTNREPDWKDAQVGAYLRITPRFRVGGSVGLGDKFAQPQHLTAEDTAPRVHLEGAFKF